MIGVLAYGIGNPSAIVNMLDYSGWDAELVHDPTHVDKYDRVILPGVGHFDGCASAMREQGFESEIIRFVASGRPFLGVCVGAQMLGSASDEGNQAGLGLLPLSVKKFPQLPDLSIPRMSWGEVKFGGTSSFAKSMDELGPQRFYFSHSYFLEPENSDITVATTSYGFEYACVVEQENVIGVQFHPEKSHKFGMALFDEFAEWTP